jgi:hypothetical protein
MQVYYSGVGSVNSIKHEPKFNEHTAKSLTRRHLTWKIQSTAATDKMHVGEIHDGNASDVYIMVSNMGLHLVCTKLIGYFLIARRCGCLVQPGHELVGGRSSEDKQWHTSI